MSRPASVWVFYDRPAHGGCKTVDTQEPIPRPLLAPDEACALSLFSEAEGRAIVAAYGVNSGLATHLKF